MIAWEAGLARAREELIEGLARRGFRMDEGRLHGVVQVPGASARQIEVRIPDVFPYRPPSVRPLDHSGELSWHQNVDGSLCLYAIDESADLPWSDPESFLARIVEWFEHDLAGWPGDPPDLDLERYVPPGEGFVIYRDMEDLIGKPIRGKRKNNELLEIIGTGVAPKGRQRGKLIFGWAEDLGELASPVRTWEGLSAILGGRGR